MFAVDKVLFFSSVKFLPLFDHIEKMAAEMKNNILIRNIPEQKYENAYDVVIDFMHDQLAIPDTLVCTDENPTGFIRLDVAHRISKYQPNSRRPIVAKFDNRNSRDAIFEYVRNLKDTEFSVNEQYPNEIRARQFAQMSKVKHAKEENKKAKFRGDKLFVNGFYSDPEFCNYPLDTTVFEPETSPHVASTKVTENGSSFIGYACPVST